MKTFTFAEFEAFIDKASLTSGHDQGEVEEYQDYGHDHWYRPDMYSGYIFNQLEHDGIIIRCVRHFIHPVGKPSMAKLSENTHDTFLDEGESFEIVDDEEDEDEYEDEDEFIEMLLLERGMRDFDFSCLGKDDVINVDVDPGRDDETYTVYSHLGPHIQFTGEIVAEVQSSGEFGHKFSGEIGSWTVLALYRTIGGRYICQLAEMNIIQGRANRIRAVVVDEITQVREFFGEGWLADELYAEIEVET
ncbi:hypothetical protein [Polycyclovorans algicola]|uniref:hypothetical protein n=1 Tax=Polycyclovorans algicola TaxID=616992 RepID=UPI0004A6C5FF|nr:hypothetical protein [Polycyclovorans algicola]